MFLVIIKCKVLISRKKREINQFFSIPNLVIFFCMCQQMVFSLQRTKPTFICLTASISRISATGQQTTTNKSMKGITTVNYLQCHAKMLIFGDLTCLMTSFVMSTNTRCHFCGVNDHSSFL